MHKRLVSAILVISVFAVFFSYRYGALSTKAGYEKKIASLEREAEETTECYEKRLQKKAQDNGTEEGHGKAGTEEKESEELTNTVYEGFSSLLSPFFSENQIEVLIQKVEIYLKERSIPFSKVSCLDLAAEKENEYIFFVSYETGKDTAYLQVSYDFETTFFTIETTKEDMESLKTKKAEGGLSAQGMRKTEPTKEEAEAREKENQSKRMDGAQIRKLMEEENQESKGTEPADREEENGNQKQEPAKP
ncbi:hypothetical protein [Blautia producta]|uniref:hypothetical protein n=1 Tax=Blautia producta TaxID=33035 RepID=UPI003983F2AA